MFNTLLFHAPWVAAIVRRYNHMPIKSNFAWFTLSFLLILESVNATSLPAFPGAEGFGAITVGGRGGRVIRVTNLNADGPGSFKAACAAQGPRIVVFEVAGVIQGDVAIRDSNITIAGQTAPAPGITLEGMLYSWPHKENERLHDIVIRFLRVRPPPTTGHNGDAIQLPNTERVILDHLSLSWANDEIIDIIYSSEVTIQWSTIEESDPLGHGKGVPHNFAILSAYQRSGNVSIHHNLFANHSRRIPSLTPETKAKPGDFRNNVIYNFKEGLGHDGHTPKAGINLIANYYKRGPNAWTILPFNFHKQGQYFVSGNYIDGKEYEDTNNKLFPLWLKSGREKGRQRHSAFTVATVKTDTAEIAYQRVLDKAGMFPRDRVTKRTIHEVKTGKGNWSRNAPLKPGRDWFLQGMAKESKKPDFDHDGMPDSWEKKNKLNPLNGEDHKYIMPSGYSAIETYINERAEELLLRYSH